MPDSEPSHLFRGKYRIPSARLRGWDYTSAGLYFVTICTKNHVPCLAEIVDGNARLSRIGEIVTEEWQRTAEIRANVILDAYVIMPNHLHGVVGITESLSDDGVETFRRNVSTMPRLKPNSLGSIIGQFKSICTKRIWAAGCGDFGWQERFYDHIIRDDKDLNRIQEYIAGNLARWESDQNNSGNLWM